MHDAHWGKWGRGVQLEALVVNLTFLCAFRAVRHWTSLWYDSTLSKRLKLGVFWVHNHSNEKEHLKRNRKTPFCLERSCGASALSGGHKRGLVPSLTLDGDKTSQAEPDSFQGGAKVSQIAPKLESR